MYDKQKTAYELSEGNWRSDVGSTDLDNPKPEPTVFKIDRIGNITGTKQKFSIPYQDKFQDGEFRKRVQFMYSGPLQKVVFEYRSEERRVGKECRLRG